MTSSAEAFLSISFSYCYKVLGLSQDLMSMGNISLRKEEAVRSLMTDHLLWIHDPEVNF